MSCETFQRWIEDEASGALGPRQRALLRSHCEACPGCGAARRQTKELVRLLASARQAVPAVEVRVRVMEGVRLEEELARMRARIGRRSFWAGMAASCGAACLLAALAGRAAVLLPAQALPAGRPLLGAAAGLGAAIGAAAGVLRTLLLRLMEAVLATLDSLTFLTPLLEQAALVVLALTLLSAALPVARALRSARRPGGAAGS